MSAVRTETSLGRWWHRPCGGSEVMRLAIPLVLSSLSWTVLLASGTWIAMDVLQAGLHGCWTLVTAWIWVLGAIYMARFLRGQWRSMRVIEMGPVTSAA